MTEAADHYADPGFDAERYDRVHAGQTRDVAFYVDRALRGGGPVLEIGCGTGRVSRAIAAAGVPVVGLDRSAPMLAVAAGRMAAEPRAVRARAAFVRADARAFAFRRPFPLVVAPFRTFQAFLTVAAQLAVLRCVRNALGPAGRFAFDVFTPDPESVAAATGASSPLAPTGRTYVADGGSVVEHAAVTFEPGAQLAELEYVYERRDERGTIDRSFESFRIRWFHRYELEHLLARAGFAVESVWGGWDRAPLEGDGEDAVWVARPV